MEPISVEGHVDDQHRLLADVPGSIPPGPITVWIAPPVQEDDAGSAWTNGVAHEWREDLNDARQDIYTLGDGEPVDPS
jgi:hypothetical protein